jgi:xylan 1,4-beta-xylosidase
LPIIIGESDPEGCAACSMQLHPQNGYRNGTMYSSYTAAAFARKHDLAARHKVRFEGAVTWAFEFEDQRYFDGFRDLATNGIDKPVLNVFRMFGMMGGERVAAKSSGALDLDAIVESGVRAAPDINALASRGERSVTVMVWNYHDDDLPAPAAAIEFSVSGVAGERVLVHHYRVDGGHGNSYEVWKKMGEPQSPTEEQHAELEAAGQLAMLGSPEWRGTDEGKVNLSFSLPRQGVSLLTLQW